MPQFEIQTVETVAGRYLVDAATIEQAQAKFDRAPGRLIDFDGVEQVEYDAFEVDVRSATPVEPA